MELEKRVSELESKSAVMFGKLDQVRATANEALTLARHASKGFVELAVEIRSLKADMYDLKEAQKEIRKDLEAFKGEVHGDISAMGDRIAANLKWAIGLFFTMLSIFAALIKFT